MFLKLHVAQGFGLVTPDPFSLRELCGVYTQDYKPMAGDSESTEPTPLALLSRFAKLNCRVNTTVTYGIPGFDKLKFLVTSSDS